MLGANYHQAEYLGVADLHHAPSPALYLAEKDWTTGYVGPSTGSLNPPLPSSSFIKPSLSPQNALVTQVSAQEFNTNFYSMCPQSNDMTGK
jgi:hypothetical protein